MDTQNQILKDAIVMMAKVIESKEDSSGKHIDRIINMTKFMVKKLKERGFFKYEEDLFEERIFIAAALHDIGKGMISEKILLKPGKLTFDEFEVIKRHTELGAMMISGILKKHPQDKFLLIAKEIALSHHEKWDGTGYPLGKKEFEIPLSARIVSIVDVYDALRTKKSYKEEMSKEEALSKMKIQGGIHFDPEILEVFLNNIDQIEEERLKEE